MTMQPPLTAPLPTPWTAMKEHFVPPLVIPVAVLLAVLLFVLIHGPVA
ncbi:hypothetical protein [Azospirillum sp. TSO22-1]|nr:hypothetical protein [Azospirillum sp. TSO22-1]